MHAYLALGPTMHTIQYSKPWHGRVLIAVFAAVMGVLLAVQDADARRMGGGRSFGRQSPNATRQATPPSQDATRTAPQQAQPNQSPAAQQPRNRWLGPLAGLAAGLGISALLSHFGLMGPFAGMLGGLLMIGLLVVAAVVIWRLVRGSARAGPTPARMEPAYQGSGSSGTTTLPSSSYDGIAAGARPGSVASLAGGADGSQSGAMTGVPADFDVQGFLRNAKVHFLRLQAAWDARDFPDIREFTTPEVFAELKMQIEERKGEKDRTEVGDLEAQLLGIDDTAEGYLASVRFAGRIRESADDAMEPFVEVWNLWKAKTGTAGWLLAGIQQVH